MLTRTALDWRDPLVAFAPLRDEPFALLLHGGEGRWSYICADPAETLLIKTAGNAEALDEARKRMASLDFQRPADAPPFCGGWAGCLSYEFSRAILPKLGETPPRGTWPDLALGLYDQVIAFDHERCRAEAFNWSWDTSTAQPLSDRIGNAPLADWHGPLSDTPVRARLGRADYEARIAKAIAYTHAGDCFQANISQRFDFDGVAGAQPFDYAARLFQASRAPFSAYLRLPGLALVSNSPERFLRVRPDADGHPVATTEPIKGTRPRGGTPEKDAALAAELQVSEKDLAENLMIVDLMRNDLSRVSTPGSVTVPRLQALETFANVHHLVSTVEARLLPGCDGFDVLRAAFPGGSVTGAPKIRAMQIISELEDEPRGPYCGSLVWMTPDGWMDSSILIRSAALEERGDGRWHGHFRSGGGVVADSNPAAEYLETLDKARALKAALENDA
jgi:para-aminobenzoate synthetase component 1